MADERPNPLKEVANKVGVAWATAASVVGMLVTFGVFTAAQGNAVSAVGDAIPGTIEALGIIAGGLVPLVGGVVAAFRTVAAGRDHVTPVSSPRDNDGNVLVPLASVSGLQTPKVGDF